MLTYSFTDIGSDSLYGHLYKCIKNDIVRGVLRPGEKLPSKRSFAKNLGISVITVENAYARLISEGYIYSIQKKGFFIADIKNSLVAGRELLPDENVQLSSGHAPYFADFTSNQTRSDLFPFSVWAKLMRELLSSNQIDLLTNPPVGGIILLRKAIAGHLYEFHGMSVLPEQIIIGAGTEYLYGLLIQLLGFDVRFGVEEPGYSKIYKIYKSHNVDCETVSLDASGIVISELEEKRVDVIHISPSHHFPTGTVTPISRRYELLGWASRAENRYIIEDDYDSELRLNGQPIPSLQSIDVLDKVIYMNTFTKTLASTVRISYMILPKRLAKLYYENFSFYSCTVSNFEQYALAGFISEGYFEKHINRLRNHYRGKRDMLLAAIRESALSQFAVISEEDAGLHFLLQLRTDLSDMDLCRRLEQKGVKLSPLSQYYINPPDNIEHIFVMNYSFLEEDNIKAAVDLICETLR